MSELNTMPLEDLFLRLFTPESLMRQLHAALDEDLGVEGDITSTSIIEPGRMGTAKLVSRQAGVIAGLALIKPLAERIEETPEFVAESCDGELCQGGQCLGTLSGSLASILILERTMLNYLGRLSGIATLTRQYVEAIDGTRSVICDTRKTTPGMRNLEKYAVRCGGGTLHRIGLFDAALYKDNHLAHIPPGKLGETLAEAIRKIRIKHHLQFVEVEVDTIEQFEELLGMEKGLIDIVLLDNMATGNLIKAVELRNSKNPELKLEASGGVTLETVRAIAETGVDRISVGALTHSAKCLDVGLDIE